MQAVSQPSPIAEAAILHAAKPSPQPATDHRTTSDEDALWAAARALETSFLSEMLDAAGFGRSLEAFGGGEGEEQFSSLLRDEQAKAIVESGGFGLAEQIFRSLKGRTAANE